MRRDELERLHVGYTSTAEITIDAPASVVWRHVVDVPSWLFDYHFEPRSVAAVGRVWMIWPDGAESAGGSLRVAPEERVEENAMLLTTLALVPERLWSAINPPAPGPHGSTRSGQTLISLADLGPSTHVTGIRGHQAICPTEEVRDSVRAAWEPLKEAAQFRWTTKYLPKIKELAEASAAAR